MSEPLVSVVIPTRNSARTLPYTLASLRRQTYGRIEVIVVDAYSSDETVDIARRSGARIIRSRGGLLWARYIGHLASRGEVELLLDSDQILGPDTVERVVRALSAGFDVVILGESSWRPSSLVQWLFYLDRRHVHRAKDAHPLHGVLLARAFRRRVLDEAFRRIRRRLPPRLFYSLVSMDHALIHYEACGLAGRIGYVEGAVYHIEPSGVGEVLRKFLKYGLTEYFLTKYYPELSAKRLPRKPGLHPDYLASITLWALKAAPYAVARLSLAGLRGPASRPGEGRLK